MMTATETNRLSDRAILTDCLKHWQQLSPHIKERQTAAMLAIAIEVALRLQTENEKLRFQNWSPRADPHQPGLGNGRV
jgi:hypothetical protein